MSDPPLKRQKVGDCEEDCHALYDKGLRLQGEEQFEEAIPVWEECLELAREVSDWKRTYLSTLEHLGEARVRVNKFGDAIAVLDERVLWPCGLRGRRLHAVVRNLALAHEGDENYEGAIPHWRKCLELEEGFRGGNESRDSRVRLAWCHQKAGNPDGAISECERFLSLRELDEDRCQFLDCDLKISWCLAMANLDKGQQEAAILNLHSGLIRRGVALPSENLDLEAIDAARTNLEGYDSDTLEMMNVLASAVRERGHGEESLDTMVRKAWTFLEEESFDDAIALCERISTPAEEAGDPRHGRSVRRCLALAYKGKGHLELAISHLVGCLSEGGLPSLDPSHLEPAAIDAEIVVLETSERRDAYTLETLGLLGTLASVLRARENEEEEPTVDGLPLAQEEPRFMKEGQGIPEPESEDTSDTEGSPDSVHPEEDAQQNIEHDVSGSQACGSGDTLVAGAVLSEIQSLSDGDHAEEQAAMPQIVVENMRAEEGGDENWYRGRRVNHSGFLRAQKVSRCFPSCSDEKLLTAASPTQWNLTPEPFSCDLPGDKFVGFLDKMPGGWMLDRVGTGLCAFFLPTCISSAVVKLFLHHADDVLWSSVSDRQAIFITLRSSDEKVMVKECSEMIGHGSNFLQAVSVVCDTVKQVTEPAPARELVREEEFKPLRSVSSGEIKKCEKTAWVYVMEVPLVVEMKDGIRLPVFQVRCEFILLCCVEFLSLLVLQVGQTRQKDQSERIQRHRRAWRDCTGRFPRCRFMIKVGKGIPSQTLCLWEACGEFSLSFLEERALSSFFSTVRASLGVPVCERLARKFVEANGTTRELFGRSRDDLSLTELIAIDFSSPAGTLKDLMAAEDPWSVDFTGTSSKPVEPMGLGRFPVAVDNPGVELHPAYGHTMDVEVFLSFGSFVQQHYADMLCLQDSEIVSTLRNSPERDAQ